MGSGICGVKADAASAAQSGGLDIGPDIGYEEGNGRTDNGTKEMGMYLLGGQLEIWISWTGLGIAHCSRHYSLTQSNTWTRTKDYA